MVWTRLGKHNLECVWRDLWFWSQGESWGLVSGCLSLGIGSEPWDDAGGVFLHPVDRCLRQPCQPHCSKGLSLWWKVFIKFCYVFQEEEGSAERCRAFSPLSPACTHHLVQ